MFLCHTFPSRWKNLNQYKLLIIQTARPFSDKSWLHYNIAFRKKKQSQPQVQPTGVASTQNSHQISGYHFSCFRLNFLWLVTNRDSGVFGHIPGLASIATPGMMGAVAGPLTAAGFATPVKRATGTTLASTALTASYGGNGPAPLLSQRGVTAVARPPLAKSAAHSFDSVLVGSNGKFSALQFRSPFVLPSQQQGLPSSGYSLCSPAVCPIRAVSKLTPINVDRFQHELRHHPNPDKAACVV